MQETNEKLITVREAAELARVSASTSGAWFSAARSRRCASARGTVRSAFHVSRSCAGSTAQRRRRSREPEDSETDTARQPVARTSRHDDGAEAAEALEMTPAPCFRCRSAPRASAPRLDSLSSFCETCGAEAEREAEVANEELLASIRERQRAAGHQFRSEALGQPAARRLPLVSTPPEPLLEEEEIDALLVRARAHQPILFGPNGDRDQCPVIAAECCLRLPRGSLPRIEVNHENRFQRWEQRLAKAGYGIINLDLAQLPPEDRLPWVAVIRIDERSDHAVAMLGHGLATIRPLEPYRPHRVEHVVDAWRPVELT